MLCAPAVITMLIVTGYPIAYALYLSLQRFDLRFPDDKESVGFADYRDVLTSSTWWSDVGTTVLITVVSVSVELVLGMASRWSCTARSSGAARCAPDPDPLRDHHRGRRVRLALRLRRHQRLRQSSFLLGDTAEPLPAAAARWS